MMDWILDVYDLEEYRTAIIMIISFMITLFIRFVLRLPKFSELDDFSHKCVTTGALFCMVVIAVCALTTSIKQKSEERKATQLEQPLVK